MKGPTRKNVAIEAFFANLKILSKALRSKPTCFNNKEQIKIAVCLILHPIVMTLMILLEPLHVIALDPFRVFGSHLKRPTRKNVVTKAFFPTSK